MGYKQQWKVQGSATKPYTVSLTDEGEWKCSCPRWIFHREVCRHIQDVQGGGYPPVNTPKPRISLAMCSKPHLSNDGKEAFIPLVKIGDTNMEATISKFLLDNGFNIAEVREIRRLPKKWTAEAIREHVRRHGESVYEVEKPNQRKCERRA